MLIASSSLWVAATNTYVVYNAEGGPAVVIDAPPDPESIIELLGAHNLTPVALLLTHGHADHVGGAGPVARKSGAAVYVHPSDDFLTLNLERQLLGLFGYLPPGDWEPPAIRTDLVDGEVLSLAGLDFEVRHTPGHTPGHCCFFAEEEGVLFSGDQLFAGSVGRTDLPGGDWNTLLDSMKRRVLDLADDVRVLPGHGLATTIGRERRTNPFLGDL
jgi:glyoxylase-like metal-dependent hydrolase (beta-lactamase superfamily II)